MKKILLFLILGLFAQDVFSQELRCRVTVLTPQIQSSDKQIYQTLQTQITEFMNNTKWTDDKFLNQERIECSIQITIEERTSSDRFRGKIQLQSSRPVFGTNYNTTMLNHLDNSFNFRYLEFQPLEFNETTANENLIDVLAFYAYMIIGIDYDSYSSFGGTEYFSKAQTIVSNQSSSGNSGWKAFETNKNRYWLAEDMLSPIYKPIRNLMYSYHRQGLDTMREDRESSRSNIFKSIEGLQRVHRDRPGSFLLEVLFDAKSDEIVNVFSQSNPSEQARVKAIMSEIDPSNISKYDKIGSGN
ncbi:MAG: DUF4835 family protein [Bacteroidia bacterium]|nr:DUF4835 family protein [Bacteroidia bacterium]